MFRFADFLPHSWPYWSGNGADLFELTTGTYHIITEVCQWKPDIGQPALDRLRRAFRPDQWKAQPKAIFFLIIMWIGYSLENRCSNQTNGLPDRMSGPLKQMPEPSRPMSGRLEQKQEAASQLFQASSHVKNC